MKENIYRGAKLNLFPVFLKKIITTFIILFKTSKNIGWFFKKKVVYNM